MKTSVIGFPRIGTLRELKFASEKYFRKEIDGNELTQTAEELRKTHWTLQKESGINFISGNDFSFYDMVLDTAVLLGIIPKRYQELGLSAIDTYFAMARGYQGESGDVKALAMKKWFNTNYHYIVPEIEDDTKITLNANKLFHEYFEAKRLGIETKPVVIGAFTMLKLIRYTGKKTAGDFAEAIIRAYQELLAKCNEEQVEWLQFDEPSLVKDLDAEDIELFHRIYDNILSDAGKCRVLLQTYFGDVRDIYADLIRMPFAAIGLDFIEGRQTCELIEKFGFPQDKTLFAGLVNGKNIWRNHYEKTLGTVADLKKKGISVVLSTSCSLLHVPYTLKHETKLSQEFTSYFVIEKDYIRLPKRSERQALQKKELKLPEFPTTTIGSFPQTKDVKANRSAFRRGEISKEEYVAFNKKKIADCVKWQEEIGLDVLVHGEYERNDMVEYFGEALGGFLFTEKAWVQSYGTRCVKPPIIWGDVYRDKPITVEWSVYAQSQTDKIMKGMLTGPVTILNWSFPREDISIKESISQIALAIRDEVLDLEANGIRMIQIDEAALREKLPLRRSDWYSEYLDFAIPAFRLTHSGVKADTQIHTHMCYSEFTDIIPAIDDMDADVITFEASRSDLQILDALRENHFETEVGPGVYDIHSPRVPSVEEMVQALRLMLTKIEPEKLWVNPDCGLKTRGVPETDASLRNMVEAAKQIRQQ